MTIHQLIPPVALLVASLLLLASPQTASADAAANGTTPGDTTAGASIATKLGGSFPTGEAGIAHLAYANGLATRRSLLFRRRQDANKPQQVHVSLAGPSAMRVSWLTTGRRNAPSVVAWGEAAGSYTRRAQGSMSTYRFMLYWSGYIHNVVLDSLKPDTTYFYRLGGVGPVRSFKTPPAGATSAINVAIVGDIGLQPSALNTLRHMNQHPHDLVVVPGDLSYANGVQSRWDAWQRLVSPYASTRPWMTVPGNHEEESVTGYRSFLAYNARWPMPAKASGSPSNLFYSFETAGIHWVMLSCYSDYSEGSAQRQWLAKDLASVDRARTPFLFVSLHEPWFHSNEDHQTDGQGMRAAIEKTLYDARVDVLFAGHVHAYERTERMYDGKADPCGIIHITVGSGGKDLYTSFQPTQPSWSAFREASYGFGTLKVLTAGSSGQAEADWTWQRNEDSDTVAADSVHIVSLASSTATATCF
eukprot:TRINITY_DN12801_c0_g2_i2.p1 TRINITY_DN12801_c0_g2~~TRINITY_DN12801_c0_g2_i2.p1  ORF type:complete len:473 (+),score=-28.60 TRINITY_DN12801_c0_g2_i2:132-1550(+)